MSSTKPPGRLVEPSIAKRQSLHLALERLADCAEGLQRSARDQLHGELIEQTDLLLVATQRVDELVKQLAPEPTQLGSPRPQTSPSLSQLLVPASRPLGDTPLWALPDIVTSEGGNTFREGREEDSLGGNSLAEHVLCALASSLFSPSSAPPSQQDQPSSPPQEEGGAFEEEPQTEGVGAILVVDDDASSRNRLARHLVGMGFSVCTAEGGLGAQEALAAHPFDLVVLDVVMPDVDGLATLDWIRKQPHLAMLPVIMTDAHSDEVHTANLLSRGANDFASKPLALSAVTARIKAQLALKKAVDYVRQRNEEQQQMNLQLLRLVRAAPDSLDTMHAWVRSLGQVLANLLALPPFGVWTLDGQHRLQVISERAPAPTSEELDQARKTGEIVSRDGDIIVPAKGYGGELLAALVVPTSAAQLTMGQMNLLYLGAHHIGVGLELHQRIAGAALAGEAAEAISADSPAGEFGLLQVCPTCGRCYDQSRNSCPEDGEMLDSSRPCPYYVAQRYRLERLVGQGGMGSVFLAQDTRLGREVAIKVISPEQLKNERVRQRFVREARAVARVNHPNVVALYDCGNLGHSSVYIVMEFLKGRDLGQVLKRQGSGTPAQVANLLRQAGSGLSAAHGSGVLHRDLKPANFFLIPTATGMLVKIVDFGLAKELCTVTGATHKDSLVTRAGTAVGTPLYMAPEQALGKAVDFRSDVYSLAAVGYLALTGQKLSEAKAVIQILLDILEKVPATISSFLGSDVPEVVDHAFASALDKTPQNRPDSPAAWVESFVDELARLAPRGPGWDLGAYEKEGKDD
jgi:CheY-like chemotaxis protein/tRNA A-37 threonylcarbamoyl transferase component Bud32